ncbi:hypothetical protein TWF730_003645 [Orbilia blumenaviensis]|uniref:Peptidase S8/S53 domain-containing protein n=1 Tax=Orbilia blumenaviensis TaxID=1796055 RepID=A0AAV9U680_9PEZI
MRVFQQLHFVLGCLFLYPTFGAALERDEIFHRQLKIGTVDQITERYMCIVHNIYRRDLSIRQRLASLLHPILVPPRRSNLQWIESQHLGIFAVSMEVLATVPGESYWFKDQRLTDLMLSGCDRIKSEVITARMGVPRLQLQDFYSNQTYERSGAVRPHHAGDDEVTSYDYNDFKNKLVGFFKQPFGDYYSRVLAAAPVEERFVNTVQIDLTPLSQPPGTTSRDLQGTFWDFKYSGRGQLVYILDGGFDINHKVETVSIQTQAETRSIKVEKMIFPGFFPAQDGFTGASPHNVDHGTAMMAKIAGQTTGVATNTTLVLGRLSDGAGYYGPDTALDLLLKVYDDIRTRDPAQACIISMSYTFPTERRQPGADFGISDEDYFFHVGMGDQVKYFVFQRGVQEMLDEVIDRIMELPNTFFVTAAGNDAPDVPISDSPAVLGSKYYEKQPRFIVVGGYNPLDGESIFQKAKFVEVSAPARFVNAPVRWKNGDYEDWTLKTPPEATFDFYSKHEFTAARGTSLAVPAVSGMIAAWLSIGFKIEDIAPLMKRLAYERIQGGPKVLYNGVPISRWPRKQRPSWYPFKSAPPPPKTLDFTA